MMKGLPGVIMDSATSELGNIEFSFGEYGPKNGEPGCPIWYVCDEDPGYVYWCLQNIKDATYRHFIVSLDKYYKAKYPKGH